MNAWEVYERRMLSRGATKREAALNRESRMLTLKLPDNLSYFTALVDDSPQEVAIIDSDNLNEKFIYSLPGETISCGALVFWEKNRWLVSELDAHDEVYTRAKLVQCNHLLRWVSNDGVIHEQWCVIEDGTKLTRTHFRVCNGLAYWKRYAKTTPLIAGTPLESCYQNRIANSYIWQWFKNSTNWAISSQAPNRRRFNDYLDDESRDKRLEMGSPKPLKRHGEDIVCALWKRKGARNGAKQE